MLKITLDTNIIIEGVDGERASVVARVKKLAEEGKIDIALTTRVFADKDRDPNQDRREKHLKEFEQYPILPTIGRYGLSRWDYDVYG